MHYYQFHIGDYQSDTRHLELMEDLAYRRMLDLYYKNENQLPIDVAEIARLIGMRSHSECIEIVLHDFFERTEQGWRNNKADEVLAATYSKSESARKSAKARWSKKGEEKQQVNANAMRTQCESDANGMLPITQDPLPITQLNTSQPDEPPDVTPDGVVTAFNKTLGHVLPNVKRMTKTRKSAINARIKEDPLRKSFDWWILYFEAVGSSDFLTGQGPARLNGIPWSAKFDWLINQNNLTKVIEGNYGTD